MTAIALGFPSPVVINWGVDFHDITHWARGQKLLKIPGFVKYLDNVLHPMADPSEKLQEDDIVVIVDGYDTWFQLPPEVLLNRYYDINKKANERLYKQWSGKGPMPMRQTIIVSSEKHCYPKNSTRFGVDLHCFDLPDSPMRADLYGPETDKNYTDVHQNRPKWINGGLYIGPAGDMRRFFRRALSRMEASIGEGFRLRSEQGMLGEVIGEQELWRKWKREKHMPDDDVMGFMERDFEYHVGFDYGQVTSLPTMGSAISEEDDFFDGDFVRLGDQAVLERHAEARGISPARLRDLPDDIKTVRNPLDYIEKTANWSDMPLYADFFTESVPVMLHYNHFKPRLATWWERPWWHRRLRNLLRSRLQRNDGGEPLFVVKSEERLIRYWSVAAEAKHRYPRRVNETIGSQYSKMEFNRICRYPKDMKMEEGYETKWWDEVFRDNGGRFRP
ncbi:hypothetical protein FSARC_6499 [Fusarium sarcochroum]|uniref:Uncharacterized protein n=1 Tax=Fusarium sarcochroum TaxID=1208366 RepID=A0A8H4X9A0_9HYPO|nr:hypothetical protein FSARC_6499 [Fusarium sarcochroum]